MRIETWFCDRCGTRVDVPYETIIVEEWSPKAIRSGFAPSAPDDWQMFCDNESVVDVCPNCVTAGERADQAFREAEAAVMFDTEPGSA